MIAPGVAVTPIMKALVAAATRSGMPHQALSTGTLITPPPIPRSDEILPAMNDAKSASGSRLTRYCTSPPLSSSMKRPPSTPVDTVGSRITFRRFSRVKMISAIAAIVAPNRRCRNAGATSCAVMPPSRLPPAVATSSSMPRRRLITCSRLRAADTELDVAMTVARLIAAATGNDRLSPRVRKGTRKTPPATPSNEPSPPATMPAMKMIRARDGVTTGIKRSEVLLSFHNSHRDDRVALLQRRHGADERDDACLRRARLGDHLAEIVGDLTDFRALVHVAPALDRRDEHAACVGGQRHGCLDPHG